MPNIEQVKASVTKQKVAKLKEEDAEKYAKLPDAGIAEVTVDYDFGANPAEAAKYFGDEVVMRLLNFAISHPIQSKIRDGLIAGISEGKSPAVVVKAIQAALFVDGKNVWIPGAAAVRKSATEKERDRLNKIEDPEKKAKEIAALKALLAEME